MTHIQQAGQRRVIAHSQGSCVGVGLQLSRAGGRFRDSEFIGRDGGHHGARPVYNEAHGPEAVSEIEGDGAAGLYAEQHGPLK
ncbi:hypothetical protein IV102_01995, partial [bacterium]|nr:hypothetical protein [bacterium]